MSALNRAETALRSSEMQLHLVTENVPAMMIVYFDRNFVCGFSNSQYAKFFGLRISLLIHAWQSCGGPQIAARQPRSYGERPHIRRGNKNKADTMPQADRRELTLLLL
jgi:PAS domain-containing protein